MRDAQTKNTETDRELYGPGPAPELTWNDVHVLVTALDCYVACLAKSAEGRFADDDLGFAAAAAARRKLVVA